MTVPRLAIFARAPVRGRVKSRLAKAVGDDEALAVYERLLTMTLERLAPGRGAFAPEIWLQGDAPVPRQAEFPVFSQPDGDLGSRMAAAFEAGVTALVGTDIPAINAAYVDAGLRALTDADVVLGPVADGGYCLIAMKTPYPTLFSGIPWSTDSVLAATLEAARKLSLSVTLLDELWDVDEEADLRRWRSLE